MKKLLFILPVMALLITGCSKNNEVTGKFSNKENDGKMIFLFESEGLDKPYQPIDSTVIKNGAFAFNRKLTEEPTVSFLSVKDPQGNIPEVIPFINENGHVQISIDSLVSIKGTPINDSYQKFVDEMRGIDKQIYDLVASGSAQNSPGKLDELNQKQSEIVYKFIQSNIKTKIGEFFLISYAGVLDMDQLKELIGQTSPALQAQLGPLVGGMDNDAGSFIGKQYIDISGDTPEGTKIALSDYIGKNKVVLIDFWASWCGPCIKEMPHVVEAYKEFKDKGFQIVGVSLDENKEDWTKAIKTLNMTWPQMSDLKGWQSELGAAYGIQSIPFTLLVNQDGKIIAENLRGDELSKKLAELLN